MALSGTVLQIRMHYPPLHIRDMTASHEDGPDIDHSWLKPVNYVLQDEAGNLHAKSWAEALDVVKQRLAGLSGDQIRGIAGKLADAESMVALKVQRYVVGRLKTWYPIRDFWQTDPVDRSGVHVPTRLAIRAVDARWDESRSSWVSSCVETRNKQVPGDW